MDITKKEGGKEMKKLLFVVMAIMMSTLAIDGAFTTAAAQTVSVCKKLEIIYNEGDPSKPDISIAMQQVWGKPEQNCWRLQLKTFNSTPKYLITREMEELAAAQPAPTRNGNYKYESFGFTFLFPADGTKSQTRSEAVQVTPITPPPAKAATQALPKIAPPAADPNLKAELDAVKARLAAAEEAERKRLASAKPVVVVKKQSVVSPLAACKANAAEIQTKREAAEKLLGECQTALGKANTDLRASEANLKTANDGWRVSEKWYKAALQKAKDALANAQKAHEDEYTLSTVIWLCVAALIVGALLGYAVTIRRLRRTP